MVPGLQHLEALPVNDERRGAEGISTGGRLAVVLAAAVAAAVCGGGSGTPSAPSPPSGGSGGAGGGAAAAQATITITPAGVVSPRDVTIAPGGRVTFVNNNSIPHDISSDPHPEHTDCPEINQVGFLLPGQSRTTGNLNTPRTCGYHDHNRADDPNLRGTITIRQP